MRKTSVYTRKRARIVALRTFNGAEWMNAINRVRSYSEAPPDGFAVTTDAALRAENVVRKALQSLLDCALPDDPEHEHDVLAQALGVSVIRALQIQPHDNPMLPVLKRGSDALEMAIARHESAGTWGLDGPGRIDLMEAIDIYAQILHLSSPAQMTKATDERLLILRGKTRAPITHTSAK